MHDVSRSCGSWRSPSTWKRQGIKCMPSMTWLQVAGVSLGAEARDDIVGRKVAGTVPVRLRGRTVNDWFVTKRWCWPRIWDDTEGPYQHMATKRGMVGREIRTVVDCYVPSALLCLRSILFRRRIQGKEMEKTIGRLAQTREFYKQWKYDYSGHAASKCWVNSGQVGTNFLTIERSTYCDNQPGKPKEYQEEG